MIKIKRNYATVTIELLVNNQVKMSHTAYTKSIDFAKQLKKELQLAVAMGYGFAKLRDIAEGDACSVVKF